MAYISAPRGENPRTRTDRSADGTGVFACPGQAVLVNECLWDRRAWCLGAEDCCLTDPQVWNVDTYADLF
jgi:hypothetical protein